MLPYHPLFSEAGIFQDPHQQWARLSGRIPAEERQALEASFRLALRVHASQRGKPPPGASITYSVVHSVRTGCILAEEWDLCDRVTLATALLHDMLEICPP